jgi:hypothetical protein
MEAPARRRLAPSAGPEGPGSTGQVGSGPPRLPSRHEPRRPGAGSVVGRGRRNRSEPPRIVGSGGRSRSSSRSGDRPNSVRPRVEASHSADTAMTTRADGSYSVHCCHALAVAPGHAVASLDPLLLAHGRLSPLAPGLWSASRWRTHPRRTQSRCDAGTPAVAPRRPWILRCRLWSALTHPQVRSLEVLPGRLASLAQRRSQTWDDHRWNVRSS